MARRKRKKAPQQPKVTGPNYTGPLIIAVVILVAIIGIMHFANADRSWQEYIGAGDRALERGNYDWAEKMYREALQYAEGKGAKDPLVAETRKYLKRLEKARTQEKGR